MLLLECDIVAQDWDSQIPSLLSGKFDVVLTMGPNEERRKAIDFSNPYVITPNTFLVAADGPLAKLPHSGEHLSTDTEEGQKALAEIKEALNGMTLGASLSTSQLKFSRTEFWRRRRGKNLQVVRTGTARHRGRPSRWPVR